MANPLQATRQAVDAAAHMRGHIKIFKDKVEPRAHDWRILMDSLQETFESGQQWMSELKTSGLTPTEIATAIKLTAPSIKDIDAAFATVHASGVAVRTQFEDTVLPLLGAGADGTGAVGAWKYKAATGKTVDVTLAPPASFVAVLDALDAALGGIA